MVKVYLFFIHLLTTSKQHFKN